MPLSAEQRKGNNGDWPNRSYPAAAAFAKGPADGLGCFAAKIGAGEGNRTLVISLEGFCSTIELHPRRSRHAETWGHYPTFLAGKIGPTVRPTTSAPMEVSGAQGLNR
jgi:hypothetical protein